MQMTPKYLNKRKLRVKKHFKNNPIDKYVEYDQHCRITYWEDYGGYYSEIGFDGINIVFVKQYISIWISVNLRNSAVIGNSIQFMNIITCK